MMVAEEDDQCQKKCDLEKEVPFFFKPSVGTWLQKRTLEQPGRVELQRPCRSLGGKKPNFLLPSVGTWLQRPVRLQLFQQVGDTGDRYPGDSSWRADFSSPVAQAPTTVVTMERPAPVIAVAKSQAPAKPAEQPPVKPAEKALAKSAGQPPAPAPEIPQRSEPFPGEKVTTGKGLQEFQVVVPKPYPGVQYRRSMNLSDRWPRYAQHGSMVKGYLQRDADRGDDWLVIAENVYLPMKVNEHTILQYHGEYTGPPVASGDIVLNASPGVGAASGLGAPAAQDSAGPASAQHAASMPRRGAPQNPAVPMLAPPTPPPQQAPWWACCSMCYTSASNDAEVIFSEHGNGNIGVPKSRGP